MTPLEPIPIPQLTSQRMQAKAQALKQPPVLEAVTQSQSDFDKMQFEYCTQAQSQAQSQAQTQADTVL